MTIEADRTQLLNKLTIKQIKKMRWKPLWKRPEGPYFAKTEIGGEERFVLANKLGENSFVPILCYRKA